MAQQPTQQYMHQKFTCTLHKRKFFIDNTSWIQTQYEYNILNNQ